MSLPHSHDNQKRTNFHQDFQCLQGRCKDPVGYGSLWQGIFRAVLPCEVAVQVLQQQDSQFSFCLFGVLLYWLFVLVFVACVFLIKHQS